MAGPAEGYIRCGNQKGDWILVHQYRNNGYNIVMDVNSGAVHVVDDVAYDVIAMYEKHDPQEIVSALERRGY